MGSVRAISQREFQVSALAWLVKDIHRMILKSLLYLGCPECSGEGYHLCTLLHSSLPNSNQPPSCWKTSPQQYTATTMLHSRDNIGWVMSGAGFLLTWCLVFFRGFFVFFIRSENFVSHGLRVLRVPLANSWHTVIYLYQRSGFLLATLPYRSDWWSAGEMIVLSGDSPFSTE